jgi:hypothetical protein
MWPFRSTRDRIEMLREMRKPAPELEMLLGSLQQPAAHWSAEGEEARPRVSANFSAGTVTLASGDPAGANIAMTWDRVTAARIANEILRAAESLDDSVDVDLSELEKRDG